MNLAEAKQAFLGLEDIWDIDYPPIPDKWPVFGLSEPKRRFIKWLR